MPRNPRAASHPILVRKANLGSTIEAALNRAEPFTRGDLASDTGLSLPTITSVVTELLGLGLLRQVGKGAPVRGRRPALLEFNARYGFLVGIDLGVSEARLAVTDLRQTLLARRVMPVVPDSEPARVLGRVASEVYALLAEATVAPDRVLSVGVSLPGVVDEKQGVLLAAPDLAGWHDVPVRDLLEQAFAAPVAVANDVHLAMIAEHARGAAKGHDRCALVSVGTGIGSAVLVDGRLDRGYHFMAGQIGFMCLGASRPDARRGGGALETLAGVSSLRQRIPPEPGEAPAAWIARVLGAVERDEVGARGAVLESVRLAGIAAANLAAVVDPSIIVFGGPLFSCAPRLVAAAAAVVHTIWHAPVLVAPSALADDAPLWGTVFAARKAARVRLRRELWPQWPTDPESLPDSL